MNASAADPSRIPVHELIDLTGRVAIVTGGAKGIGLAIARRLHEAGANLVLADADPDAEAVAAGLERARAGSAIGTLTDISDEAAVEVMTATAVERFGRIDILVNNAGIFPMAPVLDLDTALLRRVLDVNLVGLVLCTRAVARQMVEQGGGGRVINVTSIDALHPSSVGLAAYDASKHGAWGFTKNVALELAPHGVLVNAIAPGGILTPGVGDVDAEVLKAFEELIPMHRMGNPDEIGRAALFLASDLSSYMTGAQIVVDGGRLLR